LAKKRLAGNDEVSEYLREIESGCQQIVRILEFSKDYEMLGVEELTYIDVNETFEKAISLFSNLNRIRIENECRGLVVLADSLLRQVFYNLVDNSLKHGEKVGRIRVHYEEAGKDQLRLVYEDDGVGVPFAEKPQLFKEGYGRGTGYGLFMIKRICEVYGWSIQETGEPGKGARFTLTTSRTNQEGKQNYQLRHRF
jgi:signal transduction histidine kinase